MKHTYLASYEEQEEEAKKREIKELKKQREEVYQEAYRKAEAITLLIKEIEDRE